MPFSDLTSSPVPQAVSSSAGRQPRRFAAALTCYALVRAAARNTAPLRAAAT
jgi:hypothetical protein